MNCPACKHKLSPVTVDSLTIDVCKDGGCGGIFFDAFELKKVDEPGELTGEKLAQLQAEEAKTPVTDGGKRPCPKCTGIKMMRHFFSVKKQVLVDECGGCGGMWLDAGELDKIRHEYGSEAESDKAANDYFSKVFDPQFSAEKKKEQRTSLGHLYGFFSTHPGEF